MVLAIARVSVAHFLRMSEPESRSSHSFQWGASVVAMLPVVYLLGAGR
jgi:hypothetical protein